MALRRSSGDRRRFLSAWVQRLRRVVAKGLIPNRIKREIALGRGQVLRHIETINGPRVAGLRIDARSDVDRVISFLEKHDYAMLRRTIPIEEEYPDAVNLKSNPLVGWYGPKYVIYIPWSDRLAEKNVQTQTLLRENLWKQMQGIGNFWVVGLEESYHPVILSLDLHKGSSHYFWIGETQSGKSTAMVNAIAQLAICPKNKFVFIDVAKKGDGLGIAPEFHRTIGPPAYTLDDARAALIWLRDEMEARYGGSSRNERIIVVIDELPGLSDDSTCTGIVDSIASAGASCNIHLFLAAQHAVEKALGPFAGILKANCSGRVMFRTGSLAGSVEGLYDKRALHLQVPGDCYALNANMLATRLQASYFPETVLKARWEFGPPEMDSWPDVQKADLPDGNGVGDFTEYQIAEAARFRLEGRIRKQSRGYGRVALQSRLGIGQNPSVRLLQLADQIIESMKRIDFGDK